MNLRSIARALGGEVSSGQVLAPGPGHSKRDRSLAVKLSPHAPDGFVVYNFVDPLDWRPYRDHVCATLGIVPLAGQKNFAAPRSFKPAASPDMRARDAARRLFAESVDPRGTLADAYLARERGLPGVIDDVLALTLRYHSACPFKDGEQLVRAPALVAALRDPDAAMHACSHLEEIDVVERQFLADAANVLAVQRIRLDADGRKIERRSLGPLGNGVVFVSSIFESFYSATATIAEGVEVGVSRAQAGLHRRRGYDGMLALQDV